MSLIKDEPVQGCNQSWFGPGGAAVRTAKPVIRRRYRQALSREHKRAWICRSEFAELKSLAPARLRPACGRARVIAMGNGSSNKPSSTDRVSESRVKVRYAETDQMSVAYYANYFVWFEVGRSQFCNDCGFSYRDMEQQTGLYLIVADARCRYKIPARYEDELIVRTRLTELTRRTVRFGYEIERTDGARIATGETLHVLINEQGRPSTLPDKFLALLRGQARS